MINIFKKGPACPHMVYRTIINYLQLMPGEHPLNIMSRHCLDLYNMGQDHLGLGFSWSRKICRGVKPAVTALRGDQNQRLYPHPRSRREWLKQYVRTCKARDGIYPQIALPCHFSGKTPRTPAA